MPVRGFGELAEALRRSTVQVLQGGRERGSGSGVVWDADGLIVTNAHVARGDTARIELWDGSAFHSRVIARDTRRDLATLRIPARGLAAISPGDSSALRPGELVMAVGNPLGFIGALTTGVVHAHGPLRGFGRRNWVQAAVRLAPGNSGGPLADAQGRLIGINTMVVSGGFALAVPSNTVADFVSRGDSGLLLGVTVRPVPLSRGGPLGMLVLEVAPTAPLKPPRCLCETYSRPPMGSRSAHWMTSAMPWNRLAPAHSPCSSNAATSACAVKSSCACKPKGSQRDSCPGRSRVSRCPSGLGGAASRVAQH